MSENKRIKKELPEGLCRKCPYRMGIWCNDIIDGQIKKRYLQCPYLSGNDDLPMLCQWIYDHSKEKIIEKEKIVEVPVEIEKIIIKYKDADVEIIYLLSQILEELKKSKPSRDQEKIELLTKIQNEIQKQTQDYREEELREIIGRIGKYQNRFSDGAEMSTLLELLYRMSHRIA